MAGEILQRLAETPLTKLRIGEARFRRELASLGYSSIIDVLNLPLKTVDEKLTLDASEQLDKLRDKFREDPVAFGRKVLPQSNTDAMSHVFSAPNNSSTLPVMPIAIHAEGPNLSPAMRRHAPTAHLAEKTHRTYCHQDAIVIAPKDKYFERLLELENKARSIFDDLEDRYEVVMVHMAFDELAVELDCIRDDFRELFSRHKSNHREALSLIDGYLRNIYLVYLADRARELFDGEKLWPYVFDEIDITGQNVQIEMKRLFVNQLDHWPKMPRYAEDESDFYYLYTVLMHGGLSENLWGDLWRKSVLPFYDKLFKSNSHYSSYETVALELLDNVKNPESRLSPSSSVRRIFQKVPDVSVSRLLSSALNVAAQANNSFNSTSSLQMLSSSGLPDTAMIALKKVLSRPKSGQKNAPRSSRDGFVYIPNAKLSLDISSGKVLIAWPALMLPSNLAGSVIEYWVNGNLVHKETVQYSVGKSKLEAVRIPVRPSAKYSVELRLIGNPSSNVTLTGSLQQSIQRTHPGCFEFILAKNGSYQLRGVKERLTKRRTVAYLVEEKLEVVPLGGMTPGSIYETDDSWGEARVQFFTVEPGASGMIVNRETRNEIAIWHESYQAHISKDHRIGKTIEGFDLYGESPDSCGFNASLPTITISGSGTDDTLDDLDIRCICDGQEISIARKNYSLWREDGSLEKTVQLDLAKSNFYSSFIERCEITVRQKSANGIPVCRYRFAIAPIRGFHLDTLSLSSSTLLATYRFKSTCEVDISTNNGEKRHVPAWCDHTTTVPLSDEALPISIDSSSGKASIVAVIDLAAIDIRLPGSLIEVSGQRPICLHDALELGPSGGRISMSVSGWRVGRAALVMLGNKPLFYKSLEAPGRHVINLFSDPKLFIPDNRSAQIMPLDLTISSGDAYEGDRAKPASAGIKLLNCCEGIGFHSHELFTDPSLTTWLRFDAPALQNCSVRFLSRIANKPYGEVPLGAGETQVELPAAVSRALSAHRQIWVSIITVDIFGQADDRYPIEFSLER